MTYKNKRKMVLVAATLALSMGVVVHGAGRFLGFTMNGNSGMAILDCNSNGCAAAISCPDTEVGVMLRGYYTNLYEEYHLIRTTSMRDYENAAVVFYNDATHIYYEGEAAFSADDYQLGTLYKSANEE